MPTPAQSPAPTLGFQFKLYYCAAGIGATPTWVEFKEVRTVDRKDADTEADVTIRGSGGFKTVMNGETELSHDIEFPYYGNGTAYAALLAAKVGKTVIGIADMDGAIVPATGVTVNGIWYDACVSSLDVSEPIDGNAAMVKCKLSPGPSANIPVRKTVTGA